MDGIYKNIQAHYIGLNAPLPTTNIVERDEYYKLTSLNGGVGGIATSDLYIGGKNNNLIFVGSTESSSLINYEHTQSIPNTLWVGNHNLGRKVTAVHVIDTGGNQWECIFDSTNTTFEINVGIAPFAGTAILI